MGTLFAEAGHNYVADGLSGIGTIDFSQSMFYGTVYFSDTQFDGSQISRAVTFDGTSTVILGSGHWSVHIFAESVTADGSGWQFVNWDAANEIIFQGGEQTDAITGTGANDRIEGWGGSDILNGGGGGDVIDGGSGNDHINGGDGDDTLLGGEGDDSFFSTNTGPGGFIDARDFIDGGNGTDFANITRFQRSANYTVDISAGGGGADIGDGTTLASIEKLYFTGGNGNDALTGGALDDFLDGQSGNDTLRGGAGNDTLITGTGTDKAFGGDGDDYITNAEGFFADILQGNAGVDTLVLDRSGSFTAFTVNIGAGGGNADIGDGTRLSGFEKLIMTGGEAGDAITGGKLDDTLSGRGGNDALSGNNGADTLDGGDGNDTLNGGAGNDTLTGGAGKDIIIGGAGKDLMRGGPGGDIFVFARTSDSAAGANRDVIADFKPGSDKIDLSAFNLAEVRGVADFTGTAPEVRYAVSGKFTIVQVDADGNGTADMAIGLSGKPALAATDFIL